MGVNARWQGENLALRAGEHKSQGDGEATCSRVPGKNSQAQYSAHPKGVRAGMGPV